jgi:phosphoesterase RecJ-like protein
MDQSAQIRAHIEKANHIVITTHHKPDGDAMGSTLGLWHYLKNLGKSATIITPTDYGHFLHWLPGNDQVCVYTETPEKAIQLLEQSDTIMGLDFSVLTRANEIGEWMRNNKSGRCFIQIDHHLDPEPWDDFRIWDVKASSTCELIYRFIQANDELHLLKHESAECLYVGIMTDTGSFRFGNTTPTVHRTIATLLEKGAVADLIQNRLFDNFSESRTRFLGYCLYEKLKVLPDYNTAYMAITAEELERFDVKTGDTEGLVNYALSILGVNLGVLIVDRGLVRKMSFRSIGSFPANQLAGHFKGGGHHNASGGMSEDSLENTVEKFLNLLDSFKSQLIY